MKIIKSVFFAFLLVGCQSAPADFSFYRDPADAKMALSILEKIPDEEKSLDQLILSGNLYFTLNDYPKARNVFELAQKKSPSNAEALYHLALLDGFEGNPDKEIAALEDLVKKHPTDSRFSFSLANALLSQKHYDKARRLFDSLLATNPKNTEALAGKGRVSYLTRNFSSAVDLYSQAIELDPENSYLYADRSRAYVASGHYNLAQIDLEKAVELDPDNVWHRIDLARLKLNYVGKPAEGVRLLNSVLVSRPDNVVANELLANYYYEENDFDKAYPLYQNILKLHPDYITALLPLGVIAYAKGDWPTMGDSFERLYNYDPSELTFPLFKAVGLIHSGKQNEATSYLGALLPRLPQGSMIYELYRFFMNPSLKTTNLQTISDKEPTSLQKTRYLFFLGVAYQMEKLEKTSLAVFNSIVMDGSAYPEQKLAAWEAVKSK